MIAKGGQCRRVIYTPGRSTWDAMRYTGEYQIRQSRQEEQAVTVELPGSFGAFPGDRVTLHLEKLGLQACTGWRRRKTAFQPERARS